MRMSALSPRLRLAAVIAVSAVGFAIALVSYLRYASVWLRSPPRLDRCVMASRRLLMREEPVTGSVPQPMPDGAMVYLRPNEARAVQCMGRSSSAVAAALTGAFAEIEPVPRAKALLGVLRDRVPRDASGDRDALAAWMIASGAFRAIPEAPETLAARQELDRLNACRFAGMRTPCPERPSIPGLVWATGVPSTFGLVFGAGMGIQALVRRLAERKRRKAEAAKADA